MVDAKNELIASLGKLNDAVLAKLDGLDEYNLRRPMTASGTNLLGVVKHLASVQVGYFGDTFGRPWPEQLPWFSEDAEINDDMYATADQTSAWIVDFYRRSWVHANETFAVTELEETGTVPWWPLERRHPTLRTVLLHMTVETARHAGHLDLVREFIDGTTGRFAGDASMPGDDEIDWVSYTAKVEAAAKHAAGMT